MFFSRNASSCLAERNNLKKYIKKSLDFISEYDKADENQNFSK
jgi:hypothetical protein